MFCELPAAASHAQTSPPLAWDPTMSQNPRNELDVKVVEAGCCVVVGSNAAPPRKSENRDAALFSAFLARPRGLRAPRLSDVPAPRADCAGMPWGRRRCPSTAASSTEDHPAKGGCCVHRRLIVVCFPCFRPQRRAPRRTRRSPGDRRCHGTPGRARRRGRLGWLLRCCWKSHCPTSKI